MTNTKRLARAALALPFLAAALVGVGASTPADAPDQACQYKWCVQSTTVLGGRPR